VRSIIKTDFLQSCSHSTKTGFQCVAVKHFRLHSGSHRTSS